jgi:hypothetical protein
MRATYCAECNGHLDPYLPDCPECGAHVPDHGDAHHDSDVTFNEEQDGKRTATRRRRFHFPWGLVIILGVYAGVSYAYIRNKELNSPSFIAGNHLRAAMQILGQDNGASQPLDSLQTAYAHLVEALGAFPDDKWAHEQLEQVRMVMVRRGTKPLPDLQRKADFLAAAYQELQAGRRHALPVGMRDEWDVDGVMAAPGQMARYAVFGGLVIVLLWAYKQMQEYKFSSKLADERHLDRREELKHLHSHRRKHKKA